MIINNLQISLITRTIRPAIRPAVLPLLVRSTSLTVETTQRYARLLATKATDESNGPQKGREGGHFKDKPTNVPAAPSKHAQAKDEGDYLLFHPVYQPEETAAVKVVHRIPEGIADRIALYGVKALRFGFDLFSGYRHPPSTPARAGATLAELREKGYTMSESQWLTRIIFLETVAGVPGMVAGMLRHLRSLRGLRRDGGWIIQLLEEAENERLHELTFLTIRNPGWFFRAAVIGAQGVFCNIFFFAYLLNPKICHRFVAYLEEEAVFTYTRAINELEAGHLPEWKDYDAPQIAKDYWRLGENAKLLDVLYAVRADESNHRFVNHTLANLDQKEDFNPFATHEPDATMKGTKWGLEREEALKWSEQARV